MSLIISSLNGFIKCCHPFYHARDNNNMNSPERYVLVAVYGDLNCVCKYCTIM